MLQLWSIKSSKMVNTKHVKNPLLEVLPASVKITVGFIYLFILVTKHPYPVSPQIRFIPLQGCCEGD